MEPHPLAETRWRPRKIGNTAVLIILFNIRRHRAVGNVGVPEGFPKPVESLRNLHLVFQAFHQCRRFPQPSNSSGVA